MVLPMTASRLALLVALALFGFAGNSLLCRLALRGGDIDAAGFTLLRIASGALVLWLLAAGQKKWGQSPYSASSATTLNKGSDPVSSRGDWPSALALFAYAAAFSYAYLGLSAATGALLLFGAVQLTMLGRAFALGERLDARQWLGLAVAVAGLLVLLLPGVQAPPALNAALMLGAGVAWGLYSLRGRGNRDPLRTTAGNFLRALPLAAALALLGWRGLVFGTTGVLAALASGALASGVGYALWYAALPSLRASSAGIMQLAVPVLAALGGIVLLGEPLGWRFALAAALTLGGIALATLRAR
jgi:drug/metabolite transporter (DMT)-like permease